MGQGGEGREDRAVTIEGVAAMIADSVRRVVPGPLEKMRDALLALALALFAFAALAQGTAPAITKPQVDTPKRILFVGNSYTYYNGSLHVHANRIARSADANGRYDYRAATIAGAPLHYHAIDHLITPGKLGVKEPFEVVILQGNSTDAMSDRDRALFRESVIEFNEAIARRGAKTALYMTQAHVLPSKYAGTDLLRRTAEMYIAAGNEIGAIVIPAALAFEEAYRRRPDMRLHFELDGSHPSLLGTYLAACTVYATLYGRRSEGNTYDYQGTIAREDALFLQKVADDTVAKFFGRPLQ